MTFIYYNIEQAARDAREACRKNECTLKHLVPFIKDAIQNIHKKSKDKGVDVTFRDCGDYIILEEDYLKPFLEKATIIAIHELETEEKKTP